MPRKSSFAAVLPSIVFSILIPTFSQAIEVYRFAGDRISWAYRLKVNGEETPVTAFPDIDATEYERIAERNPKSAKWLEPAAKFVGIHYAHLASSDDLKIELTASEPIRRFTIHPKRRAVQAVAEGEKLRFEVDSREPRYFVIEVNDLPPLSLIVDPPEKSIPSPTDENVVDADEFLVHSSGKIDQTENFAKAIEAVSGTGKILYIPAGVYSTDTIKIHEASDFGIYLAKGCLIRTNTSPPGKNIHSGGISIDKSKNVKIFGRGYLDQQAYENFSTGNDYKHREEADKDPQATFGKYESVPALSQAAVVVMRSRDIEIEGLTVRNARCFNYNILDCDRVTLRTCKILTPPACVPEWTDGIDVVSTDSLAIDGFFAFCNDDCFAWGNVPDYGRYIGLAQSRELSRCTIRGMMGWNTRANGIRLGWYGNASTVGIRDIRFENCDFCGVEASGILLGKLKEESATSPKGYGTLQFVNCGFDCDRIHGRPFASRKIRIERLEFENVDFDAAEKAWVIEGEEPDAIGELVFRSVRVAGKKVLDLKQSNINVKNAKTITVE
jgi:hypothetical protein